MRLTVLWEFTWDGRRIWRVHGGDYVVEGCPVRLPSDEHAQAVCRLLDLTVSGLPQVQPVARTALERVRNAGADPRLMLAIIDRALDAAEHGGGPLDPLASVRTAAAA